MKKLLVVALVLVVLVGGAVIYGLANLGALIKSGVERIGSAATQADVSLDAADVSLTSGEGSLRGLVIGNPEGYATPSAFEMGLVSLKLDTASLRSDVIVVKEIVIEGPKVTYELSNSFGSNLQQIQKNIAAFSGSGGGGDDDGGKVKGRGGAEADGGKKFIIEQFYVRGGRVQLSATLAKGQSVGADIPEIHVADIGKAKGGVTGEQAMAEILDVLTEKAIDAVKRKGLDDAAKGLLDKAGGALEGLLKKR